MTATLLQAFLPLAALITLGYLLGRFQKIDLKSVATIAIYGITPLVAFGAAARLDFKPDLLLLPVLTFSIACTTGLAMYEAGRRLQPSQRALLPVACGSGNTGYFGLPVAIALFGPDAAGIYFLANLGVVIFETSLGFYYIARGQLSREDALKRVYSLPVIYALALGLFCAALKLELPVPFMKLWDMARGAYVCVGMMIAGLALAQAGTALPDRRLTLLALCGRFVVWPLAAIGFEFAFPSLFQPLVYQLLIVLSLAPIAANLPAYAASTGAPAGEAAMLVLISTLLAILGLPLVLPLLL